MGVLPRPLTASSRCAALRAAATLLATGLAGRVAWAVYDVLPLAFIPAGVSAFEALRERAAGPANVAMFFAVLATTSMMLGLMRWPSIHWELGRVWELAPAGDHLVLAAVFDGLNLHLGTFVREFVGELRFSLFFVLSGLGLLRHQRAPVCWLVENPDRRPGSDRDVAHVTAIVDVVSAANSHLLPAWTIGFGMWLACTGLQHAPALEAA